MKNTKLVTLIGIMTALSFVLYMFEVPVGFLFPSAPFLKIDFSDMPAFLLSIAYGPLIGTIINLLKNILHFMFMSQTPAASGEIANFFAGLGLYLPISVYYFYFAKGKEFKLVPNIILFAVGVVMMVLVMIVINFNITLPLYGITTTPEKWAFVNAITPFNVFKGTILAVITLLLYPRLRKFLVK